MALRQQNKSTGAPGRCSTNSNKNSPAARSTPTTPRQTNYANTGGGFVALRRDATFVIFPRPPTTKRQQTDFAARGFTTSKISFQLATDYIVPPQRRVTTRPAQWERGFVAPGAQSPTTSTHRVERGRECGGSTSKGGGASLMDEDGGDGVRLLPLPESSWPANDAQC